MKKIVVLGSKPGAIWPAADAIYCANGAVGFYAKEIGDTPSVINVVSARILNKSRNLHAHAASDFYSNKLSAICEAKPSKMILIGSSARPKLMQEMGEWLKAQGYTRPIEYIDPETRIRIQKNLTRLAYPMPFKIAFRGALRIAMVDLFQLIFYRLGIQRGEVDRRFRPSTGIIALLLAINEHAEDAEYALAGIGLSERNLHQVNGQLMSSTSLVRRPEMEPHIAADRLIIEALARRFRICSEEPSINSLIKKAL